MPGTDLMPPDDNRIVLAIGLLQGQVSTLTDRLEEMAERTTAEHRKVHDIVVAQSEAVRNMARDVAEMKPHVEGYKMKAASIDEAVTSARKFEVDQAEKRGADKFKNWIYGIAASVGGIIALALGKLFDWITSRPHIPIIAILVSMLAIGKALAQQPHNHPPQDVPLHEKFYSTWYMPDNPTKSCCNKADCYPTEITFRNGAVYAKRREDGKWLKIPDSKIEQRRDNPDGRNHLCAPMPSAAYPDDTVFCFSLGAGG